MAEIVWTTEALDCLERIHDYIAADNPKAARKVANGIYHKITKKLMNGCLLCS